MADHSFNDWDIINYGVMGGLSQEYVTLSNVVIFHWLFTPLSLNYTGVT